MDNNSLEYRESKLLYFLNESLEIINDQKLSKAHKSINKDLSESDNFIKYDTNFTNDITSIIPENKYAKLLKISDFINDSKDLYKPLNESLNIDINTIKHAITKHINNLESINDFDMLPDVSLNIKINLNSKINIKGFNIYSLLNYDSSIFEMIYDKTYHKVFIININDDKSISHIRLYDIKTDTFTNIVDQELLNLPINRIFESIKFKYHNNMIVIYKNMNKLGLKFEDNLYNDNKRKN